MSLSLMPVLTIITCLTTFTIWFFHALKKFLQMRHINYYSLAGHLMTCEGLISAKDSQPVDKKNRHIYDILWTWRYNKITDSQERHKHLHNFCILGGTSIMAYAGRLCQKGVPFSGFRYTKGWISLVEGVSGKLRPKT